MNIRHFTAPDARRAIRMIREALGADAVILSNRRTEIGVEMVAAVDYPDQAAKPEATGGVGPAPADDSGPALQAQAVDEIRQEVAMLRRMLESQATGLASNNEARRQPIRSQAGQFLAKLGITDDVSSSVISSLGKIGTFDDARRRSLQELAQRLPVLDDDIVDQGGRFALVGPTGVGKTTAIAKLAARFTLRNPAGDLALVTTDTYRVGAVDQLRAFGNMLGVPVHVASDGAALQTTLAGLDARLVLIDTTGVGQRDQRLAEQFDSLRASLPVRYLLTIPANAQTEAMAT